MERTGRATNRKEVVIALCVFLPKFIPLSPLFLFAFIILFRTGETPSGAGQRGSFSLSLLVSVSLDNGQRCVPSHFPSYPSHSFPPFLFDLASILLSYFYLMVWAAADERNDFYPPAGPGSYADGVEFDDDGACAFYPERKGRG